MHEILAAICRKLFCIFLENHIKINIISTTNSTWNSLPSFPCTHFQFQSPFHNTVFPLAVYLFCKHTHTHVRRLLRCIQAQIDTLRSVTETVATYLQEDWSSLLVMLTPAAAATAVSTWYSANRTCLLPNHFPYYLPPNWTNFLFTFKRLAKRVHHHQQHTFTHIFLLSLFFFVWYLLDHAKYLHCLLSVCILASILNLIQLGHFSFLLSPFFLAF